MPHSVSASLGDRAAQQDGKRKLPQSSIDRGCQVKRHKAWLTREGGNGTPCTWRPNPVYRVSTKHMLMAMDHAFQISSGLSAGMSMFKPSDAPAWLDWRTWPFACAGMDQGPDNTCAAHAAQYYFNLNFEAVFDHSHSIHNDVNNSIDAVGLRPLVLLFLVSVNVPHGPIRDGWRLQQIKECLGRCYDSNTPETTPLFMSMAAHLIEAFEKQGFEWATDLEKKSKEQQVWEALRERNRLQKHGRRTQLVRFLALVQALRTHLPNWWVDLWERTWVALEEDFLKGRSLARMVIKAPAAPEGETTTNPDHMQWDDKQFRACCQNAVVVSVLVLSSLSNRRYLSMMWAASRSCEMWHGKQNKQNRSSAGCTDFMVEQSVGGFHEHITEILSSLGSISDLRDAGFTVDKDAAQMMDPHELLCEDDFGDTFGMLVVHLLTARLRRVMWLTVGWPWSMSAILKSDEHARSTIGRFEVDMHVWHALQEFKDPSPQLQQLIRRHLFNKTSNLQFLRAMDDRHHPDFVEDLRSVVRARVRVTCPTQLIEDLIGSAKNSGIVKGASKFRRPERAMSAMVKNHVVDVRHSWHTVSDETPIGPKSVRLDTSAFTLSKVSQSLPWHEVSSNKASPPYYSAGANNASANVADLALLRAAFAMGGDFNQVSGAWVGELFQARHRLLVQLPAHLPVAGVLEGAWFMCLHHVDKSSVIAWPGRLVQIEGHNSSRFEFDTQAVSPTFLPVMTLEGIMAVPFVWRSYAWQMQKYPLHATNNLKPRIVAVVEDLAKPILEVAARKCFWKLTRSSVLKFAALKGVAIPGSESLCGAIRLALGAILPDATPQDILEILKLRMTVNDLCHGFADFLLEIDEAHEVLDRDDAATLLAEQDDVRKMQKAQEEYIADFATVRDGVHKCKKMAKKLAVVKLPPSIAQAEARNYTPPGASVWCGYTRQEWCGHMPPHKRIQASWQLQGEQAALRDVLQRLWLQWAHFEGVRLEAIPIQGLFEKAPESGASSSSGAS